MTSGTRCVLCHTVEVDRDILTGADVGERRSLRGVTLDGLCSEHLYCRQCMSREMEDMTEVGDSRHRYLCRKCGDVLFVRPMSEPHEPLTEEELDRIDFVLARAEEQGPDWSGFIEPTILKRLVAELRNLRGPLRRRRRG
jgi:hypothetical protein